MSPCREMIAIIQAQLPRVLAVRSERLQKEDESYVTEADILIQELVASYVSSSLPQHTLISEEQDNSEIDFTGQGYFVVVDPLDGTENFTSGLKEWGVGISIFSNGKHMESAIYLPEMGEQLVTGDTVKKFQSRIHGLSSSLKKEDLGFIEAGFEYRIMGCSMYNMFNAIRGSYRVFENVKGVNSWDILPGVNLALEHGCLVEVNGNEYDGQFLPPDTKYRVKIQNR